MAKKERIEQLEKELGELRDKVSGLEALVVYLQTAQVIKTVEPLPAPWVNPMPYMPYWIPQVIC